MNIYYIDYENVSSQGLKGIELLTENDEVNLLYSKKADNVKIDMLTVMMESKARIRFLPVHVGTPNALDFQLVTLLFLNYKESDYCYIISKDSGYDCCIKTAAENGAPNVARYPNIESAVKGIPAKKTRRGRRTASEVSNDTMVTSVKESGRNENRNSNSVKADSKIAANETPSPETSASQDQIPAAEDNTKKRTSRRRGRKKAVSSEVESSENTPMPSEQPADQPIEEQKKADPKKDHKSEHENQTKGHSEHHDNPVKDHAERREDQAKERTDQKDDPANDDSEQHVLQQRYLSKQFEAKTSPADKAKAEADKPVSILSVIRRRNDIQLDMHQVDLIRNALNNSSNKQQFYSYFVKQLGQKQGIELYHSVKSSYTDLVNANLL